MFCFFFYHENYQEVYFSMDRYSLNHIFQQTLQHSGILSVEERLAVTLRTLKIHRKDVCKSIVMSWVCVRVLGSAWGACLTKGAHTSLALSVRRKESYTWNHSWSSVSGYCCAEPGLAGFLPSKSSWPLPKHNAQFVHIQRQRKGRHTKHWR